MQLWNPVMWVTAIDPALKRIMGSPVFRTYAQEPGLDRLARTELMQGLFARNEELGRVPEGVVMAFSELFGFAGLTGFNALWDDVVAELVKRGHDPRFKPTGEVVIDLVDQRLPEGLKVVFEGRIDGGGWHMLPCLRKPGKKDGCTEAKYADVKGMPGFHWEPCCDPNLLRVTREVEPPMDGGAYGPDNIIHKPGKCRHAAHKPVVDANSLLDDATASPRFQIGACCLSFYTGLRFRRALEAHGASALSNAPGAASRGIDGARVAGRAALQGLRLVGRGTREGAGDVADATRNAAGWVGDRAAQAAGATRNAAEWVGDHAVHAATAVRDTASTSATNALDAANRARRPANQRVESTGQKVWRWLNPFRF